VDSHDLLAKGSLGTPAARKLQARTPDDVARRIVERIRREVEDSSAEPVGITSSTRRETVAYTNDVLDNVRAQIAPADATLKAARARRDEVLEAAKKFEGAQRTYGSGSIAHFTANDDTDADCGVVVDRRVYPALGPDGDGEGPGEIVGKMRDFVRDAIQGAHPKVSFRLTKRAIKIQFDEPLNGKSDAPDPSVDLIVALTRKDGALWIPNRDKDDWNASDPESHTKLLTEPPADVARVRRRTVRLVKGWNGQFSAPGLCSFNIEALALECITKVMSIGEAVTAWFEYAAKEIEKGNTKDPASVSLAIKLPANVTLDAVVSRLEKAAKHMRTALDDDDDEATVKEELSKVFWDYVESDKSALAAALRGGNTGFNRAGLLIGGVGSAAAPLKTTRSSGDGKSA
jgi:hypothetical protein